MPIEEGRCGNNTDLVLGNVRRSLHERGHGVCTDYLDVTSTNDPDLPAGRQVLFLGT
jgi:hypothetical protein